MQSKESCGLSLESAISGYDWLTFGSGFRSRAHREMSARVRNLVLFSLRAKDKRLGSDPTLQQRKDDQKDHRKKLDQSGTSMQKQFVTLL